MPTVTLHSRSSPISYSNSPILNPLPRLLHTPSGLAILELQGTINLPTSSLSLSDDTPSNDTSTSTTVGKLVFPDYHPESPAFSEDDTSWMKRVHLYVGRYQRLTGEVKKLGKPLAIIGKRAGVSGDVEELEIREVVYWKILFSSRPEPVGG